MISSDGNKVVGGKSARACDNCVIKRAGWYCAADDAFLCQSCDSSVHSANPLARRHERVRLNIAAASKSHDGESRSSGRDSPWWHGGFTRKPRTPRRQKRARLSSLPLGLVPEISGEEEGEEQLLYRVPIFDPFVGELCSASNSAGYGSKPGFDQERGFVPSEIDLAEFAADVESLLGKGLDDAPFDMEGLGILDYDDERVKVELDEFSGLERETFELNLDYDSPVTFEEDDHKEKTVAKVINDGRKIFLKLDCENVMSAWDDHKSPWVTGKRPDLSSDECWPHCMGACGTMHVYGEMGGHAAAMADGGREARVSRYREKRRTRLFSKKIRYEVRKLNAEKRPRMKGRFVKRANLVQFAQ